MSLSVDLFFCKRTLEELCHLDDADDCGYIEGRVFMVWPPRNSTYRIQFEVIRESTPCRFPVEIPYRDDIVFRPHDRILLALKGVKVDVPKQSNIRFSFPIALRFPYSVFFKYLTGVNAGRLIDSRKGVVMTVSEAVELNASLPPQTNPPGSSLDEDDRPRSLNPKPASPYMLSAQKPIDQGSDSSSGARPNKRQKLAAHSPDEIKPAQEGCSANQTHLPSPGDGDPFSPLGDLPKAGARINIIGIVTFVGPDRKTWTNELHRSFKVADPSTLDSPRQGVVVNCFQNQYMERLPQVQKGDIVILHKLKVVDFNGAIGLTGYGDALRWAIYDPVTRSIRAPNKGSALEKGVHRNGREFSPYWQPLNEGTELGYCQKLSEWWGYRRGLEAPDTASVHRRRHLLISEASPDLAPEGFFNCTVEVLQKFNSPDGPTVYVTDHTANPLAYPLRPAWCPPGLFGHIFPCEMWDGAKVMAQEMNPGECWYLDNVRAKWNGAHYLEGTMQLQQRTARLDQAAGQDYPLLKALLAFVYSVSNPH